MTPYKLRTKCYTHMFSKLSIRFLSIRNNLAAENKDIIISTVGVFCRSQMLDDKNIRIQKPITLVAKR